MVRQNWYEETVYTKTFIYYGLRDDCLVTSKHSTNLLCWSADHRASARHWNLFLTLSSALRTSMRLKVCQAFRCCHRCRLLSLDDVSKSCLALNFMKKKIYWSQIAFQSNFQERANQLRDVAPEGHEQPCMGKSTSKNNFFCIYCIDFSNEYFLYDFQYRGISEKNGWHP